MKYLLFFFLAVIPFVKGMNAPSDNRDYYCEAVSLLEKDQWQDYQDEKCEIMEKERLGKYVDIFHINRKFVMHNFDFNSYLSKISFRESRGNYNAVNNLGYMGRYQMGPNTLRWLVKKGTLKASYSDINKWSYIKNKSLQESAMVAFTYRNLRTLELKGALQYVGKEVHGVNVTVEGLLAGAHLSGAGGVMKFLNTGYVSKDAYGTTIVDYMII